LVAEIKKILITDNLTLKEIAEIYNVKSSTISGIKQNKRWIHVYVEGWDEYCEKLLLDKSNKLTKDNVCEIKRLLLDGSLKQSKIAKLFNTSESTIHDIKKNKIYKDVIIEGWDDFIQASKVS
jgi:predicted XRE-type DNA-binding protein